MGSYTDSYIVSKRLFRIFMKLFGRIILGIVMIIGVSFGISMFNPQPAQAWISGDQGWGGYFCSRPATEFLTNERVTSKPGPLYWDESGIISGKVDTRNYADGYYTFNGWNPSMGRTANLNNSYITGPGWYYVTNPNIRVYRYNTDKNEYDGSCVIPGGMVKAYTSVATMPQQNVQVNVWVSWGRAWNDGVTVYSTVYGNGSRRVGAYGKVEAKFNDKFITIWIDNGMGSANLQKDRINFNVYDKGCDASNPLDIVFGGGHILNCTSSWWNLGQTERVTFNDLHLTGANYINNATFYSDNESVWHGGWGVGGMYDYQTQDWLRWKMGAPGKSVNLESDAVNNKAYGQLWDTGMISYSGVETRNLTRINSQKDYSPMECSDDFTPLNSYGQCVKATFGSKAYAWYALPGDSKHYGIYLFNCQPEGNGMASFKYFDYGQVKTLQWSNQYNGMRAHKNYVYNIEKIKSGGFASPDSFYPEILGNFSSLKPSVSGWGFIGAPDLWDTIAPNSTPASLPWTGAANSGSASCAYPYPSAWVGSQVDISLPASDYNGAAGTYVYSTMTPVKLASLSVTKPTNPDARSLNADPVTIYISGPDGKTRTTNCHANATTCYNLNLGTYSKAGDYTIRACWNGDRVFTGACSNTVSFRVYPVFTCDFPKAGKNIGITDANGNYYTGDATIVKGNNPLKLTFPNVDQSDVQGIIEWNAPPAGYSNIIGQTGLTPTSSPGTGTDGKAEVKLFWDAAGTREVKRPAMSVALPMADGSNGGTASRWGQGNYDVNNVWSDGQPEAAVPSQQYMSFFWPSKEIGRNLDGTPKRQTLQVVRYLQMYGTAFDFGTDVRPRTGWHSCTNSNSNSGNPVSGNLTIISGQLK